MNLFKSTAHTTAKIVSVLLALVLWFNVTTDASFTTTVSIPVRYSNPAGNLIVASELPKTVPVQIKGSGKTLIYFGLKKISEHDQRYIPVNLANLSRGKHEIVLERNQVNLGSFSDVEVVGITENSRFTLTIDREIKKSIQVRLDSLPDIKVAHGYTTVGKPLAKPELVTVTGPEETVGSLSSIPIKSFDRNSISDADRMITARVDTGIPFVKIEPKEVTLFFVVEPLAEKVLSGIPVRMKNFPKNKGFRCEPDNVTVTISGPESKVSLITPKVITAAVQYQTYLQQEESSGDIKPEIIFLWDIPGVTATANSVRIVPQEPKGSK
ncbi:MAG: CdaR family protein [Candidatus Latescibacter sp.]|nr:CdaR family protein [Candidatus Latescibacter sp.]